MGQFKIISGGWGEGYQHGQIIEAQDHAMETRLKKGEVEKHVEEEKPEEQQQPEKKPIKTKKVVRKKAVKTKTTIKKKR